MAEDGKPDNSGNDGGGGDQLLAGKYKDSAALADGVKEAWTKLGYPELDPGATIIGKGGIAADEAKAVELYKKLESELGRRQSSKPKDDGGSLTITKPKPEDEPSDLNSFLTSRGIDPTEVVTEFDKSGKLTNEQYAKFGNLPRALIHDYLKNARLAGEAVKMHRDRAVGEAVKVAGDETKLKTYRDWAAANLDAERLANLNAILEKNVSFYPEYIRIVKNEYEAKNGAAGGKTVNNGTGSVDTSPIKSRDDLSSVMAGVRSGDKAALNRLMATSYEALAKLTSP